MGMGQPISNDGLDGPGGGGDGKQILGDKHEWSGVVVVG